MHRAKVSIIALIAVLWVFFSSIFASEQSIRLVTGDYAPYSGELLPHGGMTTEITVRAFKEMGYQAHIDYQPWKRGLINTQNHLYFGTFPYVKDVNRKKAFLFSDPLYETRPYFFARKNFDVNYEKTEDLTGLSVCLPIGYSHRAIQTFLDQNILTITIEPTNDAACFRLLQQGRADLYPIHDTHGWEVIKKTFGDTDGFKTIGKPLVPAGSYIIVSKQHPNGQKLLNVFNQGLKLLKQKGIYRDIVKRHLSQAP